MKQKSSRVTLGDFQGCFVEKFHAETLRLLDEKLVEVGTIPMGVGDLIMGAGGDQQLVFPGGIVDEGVAQAMMIKGESPFQSAGEARMGFLPRSPLGEGAQTGQVYRVV